MYLKLLPTLCFSRLIEVEENKTIYHVNVAYLSVDGDILVIQLNTLI